MENTKEESNASRILHATGGNGSFALLGALWAAADGEEAREDLARRFAERRRKWREAGVGLAEYPARWTRDGGGTGEAENAEEWVLLAFGVSGSEAVAAAEELGAASVVVKDAAGCREICTKAFRDPESGCVREPGAVLGTFPLSGGNALGRDELAVVFRDRKGPAAVLAGGSGRPFRLAEAWLYERPRPGCFQRRGTCIPVFREDESRERSPLVASLAERGGAAPFGF